jgi:hypothetical protein
VGKRGNITEIGGASNDFRGKILFYLVKVGR